ncbi:ATP-binding protein [Embleya hyalina]|uniref:ATP-binding protein n=1 Tax=Embleya hyalina TaxID=516124 RepID=A0A401Z1Y5_9ACTN|nr:ATP-binding protein [Embleya hyalina]GCE00828.1 ATP-binding protein [Embleya hyalina]
MNTRLAARPAPAPRDGSPRPVVIPLAAGPGSVPYARRRAVEVARNWGMADDDIDAVRIVVSELVGNAVRHAYASNGHGRNERSGGSSSVIDLSMWTVDGLLIVQVGDHSPKPPVVGLGAQDEEHGRGLFLVASESEQVGYQRTPGGGKVVWAARAVCTAAVAARCS